MTANPPTAATLSPAAGLSTSTWTSSVALANSARGIRSPADERAQACIIRSFAKARRRLAPSGCRALGCLRIVAIQSRQMRLLVSQELPDRSRAGHICAVRQLCLEVPDVFARNEALHWEPRFCGCGEIRSRTLIVQIRGRRSWTFQEAAQLRAIAYIRAESDRVSILGQSRSGASFSNCCAVLVRGSAMR